MNRAARAASISAAPLIVAAVLATSGCSDTTLEDLPNNKQDIVQVPVTVYQMPDQFPNIVFFCNGTTGMYINTRQANSTVLNPNDPKCADHG